MSSSCVSWLKSIGVKCRILWIANCRYYCCSVAQSCPTLCNPINCSTSGLPVPHQLSMFDQVHVHCIGDAVWPSHPFMPFSPSALYLSQHQGLFQWVVCSHQMTEILDFSISPSNEYSGLISLKVDWFELLALQGTLRNLLQHHSSKASILHHSAFFMMQLSQPNVTTGKIIALTLSTFVSRAMSLLFNTLSRFVIAFLPRSKRLLISWLQSASAVILEPKKGLSLRGNPPLFPLFLFYLPWNHEARCHDLKFCFL